MRSYISKSVLLGLAMVAAAGCSSGDKASSSKGLGQVTANIVIGPGNTLDSVTWTLNCSPTTPAVTTGTWDVSKSATISGVIGGVPSGDSCTLSIKGTDTLGAAGGLTNNCTGVSANFTAGTNTSTGAISVACLDPGSVTPAGSVTTIGTTATVTATTGASHVCGGIASYFASPGEVYAGNTIALSSTTTTPTNGAVLTTTWTSDDGFTASTPNATYPCNNVGVHTITLSVLDTITGYTSSCTANQAQFTVTCTANPNPPNTGGMTSTGGSSSAPPPATGGATGGTSSSPPPATGGTPPFVPPTPDQAILNAKGTQDATGKSDCEACAMQNCAGDLGAAGVVLATLQGGCEAPTITALSIATKKGDPWTGTGTNQDSTTITPITTFAKGATETGDVLCVNLLNCIIKSGCQSAGGLLSTCYCGSAVGADCLDGTNFIGGDGDPSSTGSGVAPLGTGPINGPCVVEEEIACNAVTAAVPNSFGDDTLACGPANNLATCLFNSHCTSCLQ